MYRLLGSKLQPSTENKLLLYETIYDLVQSMIYLLNLSGRMASNFGAQPPIQT